MNRNHFNTILSIISTIWGGYFTLIFGILDFLYFIFPNLNDFIHSNNTLALFLWAPGFIVSVMSFFPIIIFIFFIILNVKNITQGRENIYWSFCALILNTIPLAVLVTSLIMSGCTPGLICF